VADSFGTELTQWPAPVASSDPHAEASPQEGH
jgi:hypothetical protein